MPIAAIWAALKTGGFWLKVLPYIAGILAVAGVAYGAYSWAYGRGRDAQMADDVVIITSLTQDNATLKSNQRILQGAVDRQNAAVGALKADGDKRVAAGKTALAAAQRANAGLSEQADALRKSAGRRVDATPCPISETLAKVGAI